MVVLRVLLDEVMLLFAATCSDLVKIKLNQRSNQLLIPFFATLTRCRSHRIRNAIAYAPTAMEPKMETCL